MVIGGGAAGYFAAIQAAQARPGLRILILERGKTVLNKVKISGGGRCNLTHACFDPRELVTHYPRGQKELIGPFHRFACGDTIAWFGERGVETKIEEDGRMFPVTDQSQTIIDCLETQARSLGVEVQCQQNVQFLQPPAEENGTWLIQTNQQTFTARVVMIAAGSSPQIWKLLGKLGHTIVPPVPSLFTFNIPHPALHKLAGISFPQASIHLPELKLERTGPLLITHWGLSGPAILKTSAWGARALAEVGYTFELQVNWLAMSQDDCLTSLRQSRNQQAKKQLRNHQPFRLPQRFWTYALERASLSSDQRWADLSNAHLQALQRALIADIYQVKGKSTFKEEFVTAGGVDLKELDLRSFQSKLLPRLYMAGEIINVDAVTGGFNFQAAWTGGYLAGQAMASSL